MLHHHFYLLANRHQLLERYDLLFVHQMFLLFEQAGKIVAGDPEAHGKAVEGKIVLRVMGLDIRAHFVDEPLGALVVPALRPLAALGKARIQIGEKRFPIHLHQPFRRIREV